MKTGLSALILRLNEKYNSDPDSLALVKFLERKSLAYIWLNKPAFICSFLLIIAIAISPIILPDLVEEPALLAVAETALFALCALFAGLHLTYKKKQSELESVLIKAILSDLSKQELEVLVLDRVSGKDIGYDFADILSKK